MNCVQESREAEPGGEYHAAVQTLSPCTLIAGVASLRLVSLASLPTTDVSSAPFFPLPVQVAWAVHSFLPAVSILDSRLRLLSAGSFKGE